MTDEAAPAKPAAGEMRPKGRLEYSNNLDDTRLFLHMVLNLMHHMDEGRRLLYDNDLDMARVAAAVATQSAGISLRLSEFREKFRDVRNLIGVEGQRGTNALSISQYTGIPRETVRRKLKRLIEFGAVIEKSRGTYVMKPGFAQQPASIARYKESMRFTLQFMNDCLAMGLIRYVDK
jgi:hypothetical protein